MKRYLLLALFLAVIQYSQGQSSKKSYTNPICTEDGKALHVADPFIYEHEGTYYLTGTTDVNMGFDYYTSHDLVTWKFGGALFHRTPDYPGTNSFWAPEVREYKGRFYLTYSCWFDEFNRLMSCLAMSDRPEGPFTPL